LSRVEDPENSSVNSPVRAGGATQQPAPLDSRLESKAQESSVQESPIQESSAQEASAQELLLWARDALAHEFKLPNALFGVGIRTVAAVGFAAVVALLFVLLMPGDRRTDTASSFSADVRQFTAALPPQAQDPQPQGPQSQGRPSREDAAKPVIEQFKRLLAPPGAPAAQADRDPPDTLLQRFVRWRLKTSSAETAQ
jgi:hypothetical protein